MIFAILPRKQSRLSRFSRKKARSWMLIYYPDEGHGFAKRENQIDALRRTIDWFDKHLKSAEK